MRDCIDKVTLYDMADKFFEQYFENALLLPRYRQHYDIADKFKEYFNHIEGEYDGDDKKT